MSDFKHNLIRFCSRLEFSVGNGLTVLQATQFLTGRLKTARDNRKRTLLCFELCFCVFLRDFLEELKEQGTKFFLLPPQTLNARLPTETLTRRDGENKIFCVPLWRKRG
ncbi:hypothetical protein AVEN_244367-1 [Araneus ventricosus]|uniref:Uncharacterized protein n=1 Tax=Araneus ventricosus TaxID=182803 RepID=A0A4Y2PR10_ARAVE|nr:hypothetical protein AVEN_244367-1 [Araneus ventricosus]